MLLYDEGRVVGAGITMQRPRAASYFLSPSVESREPLVVVAEAGGFSVWDLLRSPKCVTRQSLSGDGSASEILSVAAGRSTVFFGGVERSVSAVSPKSWKIAGQWKGALKYEVGTIIPSVSDDRIVFAASYTDSEISAGTWSRELEQSSRLKSTTRTQGDGRWCGVCRVPGTDDIFGLTASGSLYAFQNAFSGGQPA